MEINSNQHLISGMYVRVSTNRQEEEQTIESQIAEVKSRIEKDGNILPQENIFIDDGWTGEMLQRPALDAMRDAAMSGNFQMLYVYDRGRLSRMFAYQEIIIEELVDKGIQFMTLHDVQAHTPEERVLQAMQGVFHEYERVKIAERFRRGKLFKAKNGVLINGHSLYGYNYIKKTDAVPAHYEINEDQARVVRMIFQWVGVERVSIREVIKKLYDLKIPPRKNKSEFWTKGPIERILINEAYAKGVVYYNKSQSCVARKPIKHVKYKKVKRTSKTPRPKEDWIPYKVPTIIENNGVFERIQNILKNNRIYSWKNKKYDYLLSGLVYCECGNKRAGDGSNTHGHHYYRCAQRIYNFPLNSKCRSQGVNAAILDGMVWKELSKFMNNPTLLRQNAEEWFKSQSVLNAADIQERNRLINSLSKIKEEELRYGKAYGQETVDFEQFKELMKDCKKKRLSVQNQLDELNFKASQEVNELQVDDICKEASEVLKSIDPENKKLVIQDIIDKVIIKERRGVEVCGHIPLQNQTLTEKLGDGSESRDCWVA